jgi:hypothetical protein
LLRKIGSSRLFAHASLHSFPQGAEGAQQIVWVNDVFGFLGERRTKVAVNDSRLLSQCLLEAAIQLVRKDDVVHANG